MLFHPTPAFKAYALAHRERGAAYLKLLASIGPDGEPLHCSSCGSSNLKETIRSSEAGVVYEYDSACEVCKMQVGYWAHGYWEPIPEMNEMGGDLSLF